MSRIAVMMSDGRPDAPLSSHFGKAPWIMVSNTEDGTVIFVQNDGLHGSGAAEMVIRQGCTDVILTGIGQGALARLQAGKIRAWAAPQRVAGSEALRMLRDEQLPRFTAAEAHESSHACCCGNHAGAAGSACCGR